MPIVYDQTTVMMQQKLWDVHNRNEKIKSKVTNLIGYEYTGYMSSFCPPKCEQA